MSLSGSGITILNYDGKILHQEKLSSTKMNTKAYKGQTKLSIVGVNNEVVSESYIPSSNLLDMPRIAFFKNRIMHLFHKYSVTHVIIEGYSFNSQGRSVITLGELGGVIRFSMFEANIPYIQCPPMNAKAFMTGFAYATKDQMQAAILDKYGIWIEDDNIADSYAMAQMYFHFQDQVEEYFSEGGVDKLKDLKAQEYREKLSKDKALIFQKNLALGRASEEDFENAKKSSKDNSATSIAEVLNISLEDFLLMERKLNMKKLNEKYRLKKPKKEKPKKKEKSAPEEE